MKRTGQKPAEPGQSALAYARANGLTVEWVYKLVRTGKLSHVRVYGRIFICEPKRPGGQR